MEDSKILKKIDFSDIRILLLGLFLLIVPIAVFLLIIKTGGDDGFAASGAKERLNVARRGFSFVDHAKKLNDLHAKTTGSVFTPEKANNEWDSVIKRIEETPPVIPNLEGLPPQARNIFEAQYNPKLFRAQMFMNKEKFDEATPCLLDILESDIDNSILKYTASLLLCEVYEKQGKKNEYEQEFNRMLKLMTEAFENDGLGITLQKGFQELRRVPAIFSRIENDPVLKKSMQEYLDKKGIKISIQDFTKQMMQEVQNIPTMPKMF